MDFWRVPEDWREISDRLPQAPGTYVLVLRVEREAVVQVGSLGSICFEKSYCLYVGSALGGGGLRSRLGRHLAGVGPRHWHVDWLHQIASPLEIWLCVDRRRREHKWACVLASKRELKVPRLRFGSSDCRCPAHLFSGRRRPGLRSFRRLLEECEPEHPAVRRVVLDRR